MSNEIINNSAVNNVNNLESSVPKSGTFTHSRESSAGGENSQQHLLHQIPQRKKKITNKPGVHGE